MRPTVLIDVDGVLANFVDATLAWLRREHGVYASHSHNDWPVWNIADYEQWWTVDAKPVARAQVVELLPKVYNSPGFCKSIGTYPCAGGLLAELRKKANVVAVTSPMWTSSYWMAERTEWLRRSYDRDYTACEFDVKDIVFTSSKHLVCGDIFIDDKPEHVEKWAKYHPNGIAILWDQPYNQRFCDDGYHRARDWNSIRLAVDAMQRRERWDSHVK